MKRAVAILFALAMTGGLSAQPASYAAPDGAFAFRPPAGWRVTRGPVGDNGFSTSFAAGSAETAAKIEVVSLALATGPRGTLEDVSESLFDAVIGQIEENGQIVSEQVSSATLGGRAAIRCDLVYRPSRGAPVERGYMLATMGSRFALLVAVSALQTDEAHFRQGDAAIASFAVEASSPAGAAPAPVASGRSLLDTSTMAKAAQQIRQDFRRPSADTVVAQGEPPLTRGSLNAFANLLSYVFEIQLTETEFELMQRHFLTYYQKQQDAEGRRTIALGGQSILSGLQQGTPAERERNKAEVKAVMADRFANGAKIGMEWAVAMNDAIERRGLQLKVTTTARPAGTTAPQAKSTFTQADLEATLEMLYFMWVASGRDASLVTADAVATVRHAIVTGFDRFPAQLQYTFCNAEKVYASLRGAWQNASPQERAAMAAQFGRELDWLGLTVPQPRSSGGGGGSAWSNMGGESEASLRAQTAANYAYLSANSGTFSGRSVTW
jgi:hypothetical protein